MRASERTLSTPSARAITGGTGPETPASRPSLQSAPTPPPAGAAPETRAGSRRHASSIPKMHQLLSSEEPQPLRSPRRRRHRRRRPLARPPALAGPPRKRSSAQSAARARARRRGLAGRAALRRLDCCGLLFVLPQQLRRDGAVVRLKGELRPSRGRGRQWGLRGFLLLLLLLLLAAAAGTASGRVGPRSRTLRLLCQLSLLGEEPR